MDLSPIIERLDRVLRPQVTEEGWRSQFFWNHPPAVTTSSGYSEATLFLDLSNITATFVVEVEGIRVRVYGENGKETLLPLQNIDTGQIQSILGL